MADFQDEGALFGCKPCGGHAQGVTAGRQVGEAIVSRRIGLNCLCTDERRSRYGDRRVGHGSARRILYGSHDATGRFLGGYIAYGQQQETQIDHYGFKNPKTEHSSILLDTREQNYTPAESCLGGCFDRTHHLEYLRVTGSHPTTTIPKQTVNEFTCLHGDLTALSLYKPGVNCN